MRAIRLCGRRNRAAQESSRHVLHDRGEERSRAVRDGRGLVITVVSRLSRLMAGAGAAIVLVGSTVPAIGSHDGDVAEACPVGSVPEDGFSDVAQSSVHESAIDCLVWWGIASGTGARSFSPRDPVSREQMASFLARLMEAAGYEFSSQPRDHFTDDEASAHELRIDQLATAGVVSGVGPEAYGPRREVSRDQMATFMARASQAVTGAALPAGPDRFDDDDGNSHETNINRVAQAGLVAGTGDRAYSPAAPVRREQMGSFLARLADHLAERGFWPAAPEPAPTPSAGPPNFLVILTDNHPVGTERDFMPQTWARVYQRGVQFTSSFATTPLCCPSRASILTGMYAHNHGVQVNQDPLNETTFVERLDAAGYVTGQVGKYLNSWDGSARPEFDLWVANSGGGSVYNDPTLNVDGAWTQHQGYITHILRDHAVRFLQEVASGEEPFVLHLSFTAPHDEPSGQAGQFGPAVPAPGDEDLYRDLPPYRPPNYNERDISDKPAWLQRFRPSPVGPPVQAAFDERRLTQLQTLKSVDEAIATVLDTLERDGRLDDTVVLFLTDNGFLWGEHRSFGTGVPYTNSGRIDLALRYPALVPSARVESRLVANIDIAPTIYELAGLPIPGEVDGLSLVPLLEGSASWREELLLEAWPDPVLQMPFPPVAAVRTNRYVYAENEGDRPELYDLENDPYQLENRADDPALASVLADLRARLQRLRAE